MKISTKSQYGLRALVCLAKFPDKVCPLKAISEAEGISFDYLEKIFAKLGKAGLLKSKRGVGGGYFLAKKPKEIKIGEIITALEGSTAPVKCLLDHRKKKYRCPKEKKCQTKKLWKKIQDSLNFTLNSITLADLIKK